LNFRILNRLLASAISDRTRDTDLARLRLTKLGFVFQSFNLLPQLSALENVELPVSLRGSLGPRERRTLCTGLLGSVGMGHRLHHVPSQLSGGEQQRVTIARAMANEPALLLLDEPTGDLDTKNTDLVMRLLVDLNRSKGVTLVMVTHDLHLKGFAHRVVHLRDGKIFREEEVDPAARQALIDQLFAEGGGEPCASDCF